MTVVGFAGITATPWRRGNVLMQTDCEKVSCALRKLTFLAKCVDATHVSRGSTSQIDPAGVDTPKSASVLS